MSNKTVLIVEDTAAVLQAIEFGLEENDISVLRAVDGHEGQKILETETPDLIVLDLVLPEYDGYQLLEWMNEKKLSIPVYVVSNLALESHREKALSLGVEKFFIKSNIHLKQLTTEIVERLRKDK